MPPRKTKAQAFPNPAPAETPPLEQAAEAQEAIPPLPEPAAEPETPDFDRPAEPMDSVEPLAPGDGSNGDAESQIVEYIEVNDHDEAPALELSDETEESPAEIVDSEMAQLLTTPVGLRGAIEALLFVTPEPIPASKIARTLGVRDHKVVVAMLTQLRNEYDTERRGFQLLETAAGYRMATREIFGDLILRLRNRKRRASLGPSALETLAIIAYRQPIIRAEVEAIRGVESSGTIRNLIDMGLVEMVGRKEVLGRPPMYGTNEGFLQSFGLRHLNDLPSIGELKRRLAEAGPTQEEIPVVPPRPEEPDLPESGEEKAEEAGGQAEMPVEFDEDPNQLVIDCGPLEGELEAMEGAESASAPASRRIAESEEIEDEFSDGDGAKGRANEPATDEDDEEPIAEGEPSPEEGDDELFGDESEKDENEDEDLDEDEDDDTDDDEDGDDEDEDDEDDDDDDEDDEDDDLDENEDDDANDDEDEDDEDEDADEDDDDEDDEDADEDDEDKDKDEDGGKSADDGKNN